MTEPKKTEAERKAAKAAYMRVYAKAHRAEINAARKRWREGTQKKQENRTPKPNANGEKRIGRNAMLTIESGMPRTRPNLTKISRRDTLKVRQF